VKVFNKTDRCWQVALCLAQLLFCQIAQAQTPTIQLAMPGPMFERLIGDSSPSPVVGNFVVGMRWGDASNFFDPKSIGTTLPAYVGGHSVCVNIASEDGRYFARNLYRVPPGATGLTLLDTPTKYYDALKHFPAANMAVMIRLADSCETSHPGGFLPANIGGSGSVPGSAPALTVFVNADPEDIQVRLMRGDRAVGAAAVCSTDPSHIRIAFTSRCVVSVPGDLVAGGYTIEIAKQERFKTEVTRIPLFRDPS